MESKLLRQIRGIERDPRKTRKEKDEALFKKRKEAFEGGYKEAYVEACRYLGINEDPYCEKWLERLEADRIAEKIYKIIK